MTKWVPFDPTFRGDALDRAGCYVILLGGVPIYVGQSESVRRRIDGYRCGNHCGKGDDMFDGTTRTPWGEFRWAEAKVTGKVKYAARFGEHLMLEARLIRRLRPQFNFRGLGNGR